MIENISLAFFSVVLFLGCQHDFIVQMETASFVSAFVPSSSQKRQRIESNWRNWRLAYSGPPINDNGEDISGDRLNVGSSGNNTNVTFSRSDDVSAAPNDFDNKVDIHYSRSNKFPVRKKESTSANASPRGVHYSRSNNFPDRKKGTVSANDHAERLSTFSFSSKSAPDEKMQGKKMTMREILSSIRGQIGLDAKTRSGENGRDDNTTSKPLNDNASLASTSTSLQHPLCDIDDEDCLSFSSLEPEFDSREVDTDSLCDAQDIDCQAILSKTYVHSDTVLAAALRSRSESIQSERIYENWMRAHCPTSFVAVSNRDWIRRVDMETYPVVACGGARGGVYVVNLEAKNVIAKVDDVHSAQVEKGGPNQSKVNRNAEVAKQAMEKLYGKIDGGGVVSVAISGDLVASSGREGGVKLWKIERYQTLPPLANREQLGEEQGFGRGVLSKWAGNTGKGKNSDRSEFKNLSDYVEGKLIPLGSLDLKTIVTCLKFDSKQRLWAACYDGTTRSYDVSEYTEADFRISSQKLLFQSDFTDSVLDMHLCEELMVGAVATADGGVALFSLENGEFFMGLMLFEVAARSVLILKKKNGSYCVIVGGSNGKLHQIPLNVDLETNRLDQENPFDVKDSTDTTIKPTHTGPVMCLACENKGPTEGMFISGGQDGTVRVWDSNESGFGGTDVVGTEQQRPVAKCIYALTGYKLWLGSVCVDGSHIVSDGGENSLIVRDFSKERGNGKANL